MPSSPKRVSPCLPSSKSPPPRQPKDAPKDDPQLVSEPSPLPPMSQVQVTPLGFLLNGPSPEILTPKRKQARKQRKVISVTIPSCTSADCLNSYAVCPGKSSHWISSQSGLVVMVINRST